MLSNTENNKIYSVSNLNRSVANLLEQEFAWIWVEGEISNLAQPASGHIYFSLKDPSAQVSCAMFKGRKRSLKFQPENGNQVLVRAKVSLYQPRGNYQLIIDRMEEAGDGVLRRQFEQLKTKLAAEGLFDETSKQEIPELPECISIITSKTGAAIHDVLSVIERRFPSIPVKLFPVPVQGVEAAPAICNAIKLIDQAVSSGTLNCDVILLVRGGGSLEDLWSFNEETVARAIFDCRIPVVSGVGHEIDVTIADYVADVRAATPTAAAETVTPDQSSWLQSFDWYQQRLQQLTAGKIERYQEKTQWLHRRLQQQHPQTQLNHSKQRSDELIKRLMRISRSILDFRQSNLTILNTKLGAKNPTILLRQNRQTTRYLTARLQQATLNLFTQKKSLLSNTARALNTISPLQTLERGYSITLNNKGAPIVSIEQVKTDDTIETRLHNGSIISHVESCIENKQ
ncbi:MAG: exodeoxyribonuclease VII large subunit [Gammaproteobacteria bacterium]|nr:MAG: exodeoxyribonuclease VII large subunit [Gammaproteobacteria bacterium]